jgi:hypothetical protein
MRPLLLLALLAAPAQAASLYSEADLGALIFLGDAGAHAEPGPVLGARLGLGMTSWLSLGACAAGSTHEAVVPTPSVGQYFQLYQTGIDLRVGGRIGHVGLFAEGGGGWAFFSTNILDAAGITQPYRHDGPYLTAGGGLDYRTDNPRYAFGLASDVAIYPDLGDLRTVSVRLYLRYSR